MCKPEDIVFLLVKQLEEEHALNSGCNIMSRVLLYLTDPITYGRNRERWGSTVYCPFQNHTSTWWSGGRCGICGQAG